MLDTANLEYLREQVTKLKALLDDPHPGFSTWMAFYGERMQAISDFWNSESDEDEGTEDGEKLRDELAMINADVIRRAEKGGDNLCRN